MNNLPFDEKTNPPAFPTTGWERASDDTCVSVTDAPGLTLLDYLAAKAMQSELSIPNRKSGHADVAANAYEYAAAMLEERKKYL